MSYWMQSLTLSAGSGYLMVRPSWVTQKGIPRFPLQIFFTLHSLYLASSAVILCTTNFPLTSYNRRKYSPVFCIVMTSMKPAGKLWSVLTRPSTFTSLWLRIFLVSDPLRAYFSLLRRNSTRGSDSLNLWGPLLGRGANTPPSLLSTQDLGAATRFRCFFAPVPMINYFLLTPFTLESRKDNYPPC